MLSFSVRIVIVCFAACAFAGSALADADRRDAISGKKAGKIFASVCYDLWFESVSAAQSKAQRMGFKYDQDSKLFVNSRKDQQMRINSQRCALRFMTTEKLPGLLETFGNAAVAATKAQIPPGTNVHLGTEDAGNGLTRVGAKLDI